MNLGDKLNAAYNLLDLSVQTGQSEQAITSIEKIARYNGAIDENSRSVVCTAQFTLGELYWNGHGIVTPNNEKSIYWYTLAGENGHPFAQFWLGNAYCTGQRVLQDHEKAKYWYKKAANSNIAWAQYHYGVYLSVGEHADLKSVFFWMKKAAESNVINAEVYVIGAYRFGRGIEKDEQMAHELEAKLFHKYQKEIENNKSIALLLGKELTKGESLYTDISKGLFILSQPLLDFNVEAKIQICEICEDIACYKSYRSHAIEQLNQIANDNPKARSYLKLLKLKQI